MSRSWSIAVVLTLAVAPAVVLTAQQVVPSPIPAVERPQMMVLLVDLQIPTDGARQYVVRVAQDIVNGFWTRWAVGLQRPSLFAVKTLGAQVETVQDFTWDPGILQAALARVAQLPVPAATGLTERTESVSLMCGQIAEAAPTASLFVGLRSMTAPEIAPASVPRAVYYFNDASNRPTNVPLGTSAGQDAVRNALAAACTRPNVHFTTFTIAGSAPLAPPFAPPLVGVSVRIVPHQTGAPVSIVESTSDLEDGYASVVLRDDAEKAIRSVTLGALALPLDPAMTTPQVFIRRGPNVTLLPRATVAIAAQLIDASALTALARKGANIEIGVVGVEFADGSTWSYDLAAKGRFERH